MADIKRFSLTIDASGSARIGKGNYLYVLTSTNSLQVDVVKQGFSESFAGVLGGLVLQRVVAPEFYIFTAAPGTIITYLFGYAEVEWDVTDVRLQIAAITGTVTASIVGTVYITEQAKTLATSPAQATLANAAGVTIAANGARKLVVVSVRQIDPGPIYVQSVGAGANRGTPVYGGQSIEVPESGTFDLRNDSGAAVNYNIQEYLA